jgi:hypothetical protein
LIFNLCADAAGIYRCILTEFIDIFAIEIHKFKVKDLSESFYNNVIVREKSVSFIFKQQLFRGINTLIMDAPTTYTLINPKLVLSFSNIKLNFLETS